MAARDVLTPTLARRLVAVSSVAAVVWVLFFPLPLTLDLYVTPDAWDGDEKSILKGPIDTFNGRPITVDGRVIQIKPTTVDSGTAETYLEDGTGTLPDVWIPASSVWERLLRVSQPKMLPAESSSLFTSPQVFAVWENLAASMRGKLGWHDIHRFSTDLDAWREVAGRSATAFRLAHLNPERSTSGLTAAISEFSYAVDYPPELEVSDIEDGSRVVGEIESSIVHYGPTSGDMLEQFRCFGPSYADVIYVQETSRRRFNEGGYKSGRCQKDWPPLVKIVPSDIRFSADYPCIPLRQEDSTVARAAAKICDWFSERLAAHPRRLERFHFQPSADRTPSSGDPPTAFPDGHVLEEIQSEWRKHRKLADVMIAVDRSDSMANRLGDIQVELGACLQEFVDSDRVGLVSFGDDVRVEVPIGIYDDTRGPILDAIEELDTRGATAFLDGIAKSIEEMLSLRDVDRIEAVVVITDGEREGDPSESQLDDVTDVLKALDPPIRVFIVESGGTVTVSTKRKIINASQGRTFNVERAEKDPLGLISPVAQVCGEVFSYF